MINWMASICFWLFNYSYIKTKTEKLKPLGKKDLDLMLKYKKEDCEKNGEAFDGKINMWDYRLF